MSAFHLFTLGGIPVYVSPLYFLLLLMFAGGDLMRGLIWGVCITLSLLAHEFGHALVARHLRHNPTIMLHGLGGMTSRTRSGRDVEEATIIAMGPAAGLALGLAVFGAWQASLLLGAATPLLYVVVHALLYPCIAWNLLNLIPLWPLDGGQLFRLGLMRFMGVQRATRATHWVSLLLLAAAAIPAFEAFQGHSPFALLLVGLFGFQNWRALRGETSAEPAPVASSVASELLDEASAALREERYKDAARLAQQARAQDGVPQALLDRIWEVLGLATTELGEYSEALSYLRRARPNERVREATRRCLTSLGRDDELEEIRVRWELAPRSRHIGRWLFGALGFIVLAIGFVFATSLSGFFFH